MLWLPLLLLLLALLPLRLLFRGRLNHARRNLTDSIILLTGASRGIGRQTALELLKQNPRLLILASRTPPPNLPNCKNLIYLPLDLADFDNIRNFAKLLRQLSIERIDVLINNAAVMGTLTRELTKQHFEVQFGTNYLGHFLLTKLICPLLKRSNSPRIINVASVAHTYQDLDLTDINLNRWADSFLWSRYYTYRAYGNSKFSLILFTQELNNRYGIQSVCLHPGIVRSDILRFQLSARWASYLLTLLWPVFCYFTKDCYYGCQTTLFAVNSEEIQTGAYYDDCRLSKPKGTTPELARLLWDFTEKLIEG